MNSIDSIAEHDSHRRLVVSASLAVFVIAIGFQIHRIAVSPERHPAPTQQTKHTRSSSPPTKAIEDIRVGERVLASNPAITSRERVQTIEPEWKQWIQLSLRMSKDDGSQLQIELLRPRTWLQAQLIPSAVAENNVILDQPALVKQTESVFVGRSVILKLPEMAIFGKATITKINSHPVIQSGPGQVVTATFCHSSGDVIDLVVGDRESTEAIGTTVNHPFWSEDRQAYIQADKLQQGERVRTYNGDTKRIVNKLARPGPQPVYNLEVHAEHVYYVGQQGILVHNSGPTYVNSDGFRTGWDSAFNHESHNVHLSHRNGFYEILGEVEISGATRAAHRASANRALILAIESNPKFASELGNLLGIDDVAAQMRSGSQRLRNPADTEWHHPIDNPEVMQLLRKEVHRNPELRKVLHPGPKNSGGFGQNFGK